MRTYMLVVITCLLLSTSGAIYAIGMPTNRTISAISADSLSDIKLTPALQSKVDEFVAGIDGYKPQVKAYFGQQLEDMEEKIMPQVEKGKSYVTQAIQYILQKIRAK